MDIRKINLTAIISSMQNKNKKKKSKKIRGLGILASLFLS